MQLKWLEDWVALAQTRSERFSFTEDFQGLEVIEKAGTVIGHQGDNGEPVPTPYDDCVLVMPSVRQVRAGACRCDGRAVCNAADFMSQTATSLP